MKNVKTKRLYHRQRVKYNELYIVANTKPKISWLVESRKNIFYNKIIKPLHLHENTNPTTTKIPIHIKAMLNPNTANNVYKTIKNEKEKDKPMNNNEKLLFERMQLLSGVKGIKNLVFSKGVEYGFRKVKTKFGLDMVFTNPGQIKVVTEWIKKRDNKFKDHIANPFSLNDKISDDYPDIVGEFIIKLEKGTYLFCSSEQVTNRDECKMVYLYFFGKKMYKYFLNLKKYIADKAASTNMLYTITAQKSDNDRSYWTCIGSELIPRYMDTLYFDNNVKKQITDHLDKWLDNESIYKERGLIFKTGILLHGTKGTGKTSLATAIATYLKCGLINIDCTSFQDLNIADVTESINADEERYVILLDEVDTLFADRDGDDDNLKKERTSKLLSFLDGPASPNNVIFVLTTNYYDKLDKAAIREGRIDLEIELGDLSKQSAIDMCNDFKLTSSQMNEVFKDLSFPVNPAKLQTRILYKIKGE